MCDITLQFNKSACRSSYNSIFWSGISQLHQNSFVNVKNMKKFANEVHPLGRIFPHVEFAVFASVRRISPVHPLQRHNNMHAVVLRELFAARSSTSRASRRTTVSIQRLAPSLPPAISAGK
jgi:hypothetical protein